MKIAFSLLLLLVSITIAVVVMDRVAERVNPDIAVSARPEVESAEHNNIESNFKLEQGVFYRWRTADGSIHIQSELPPPDAKAEVIYFEKKVPLEIAGAGGVVETVSANAKSAESVSFAESPFSVYTANGFDAFLQLVDETAVILEQRRQDFEDIKSQL